MLCHWGGLNSWRRGLHRSPLPHSVSPSAGGESSGDDAQTYSDRHKPHHPFVTKPNIDGGSANHHHYEDTNQADQPAHVWDAYYKHHPKVPPPGLVEVVQPLDRGGPGHPDRGNIAHDGQDHQEGSLRK